MKKLIKKVAKVLPIILVVCLVFNTAPVIACSTGSTGGSSGGSSGGGNGTNLSIPDSISGTASSTISDAAGNTWATVTTIVQILAIAAVVFAGLRYMFASADQKADIKKSLGTLAIGAILVFCAATVLRFIQTSAGEIIE